MFKDINFECKSGIPWYLLSRKKDSLHRRYDKGNANAELTEKLLFARQISRLQY